MRRWQMRFSSIQLICAQGLRLPSHLKIPEIAVLG
jgi:hypothetical protein